MLFSPSFTPNTQTRSVFPPSGALAAEAEPLSALLETVSLYLHIPFCHAKCYYCDFNSYAGMLGMRERYVTALEAEIRLAGERAQRPDGSPRRCRTVFFGGGTPSLLTAEQVAGLLAAVRSAFTLDPAAEITLEANPGALEYGHLSEFRAAGITRLSMGAQSFDAGLLRWMGRIHTPDEIGTAVAAAREAGLTNLNLDFIYALPGQPLATWEETLDQALALRPPHLSLYSLIVEDGTPLQRWVDMGRVEPVGEDLAADMYDLAAARLAEAGYLQYEISNWALPGHACQHNLTYWQNLPYLGLGAGAHSWYAGHRYSEVKPIGAYLKRVETALHDGTDGREAPAAAPQGAAPSTAERTPPRLPAAAIVEDEQVPLALQQAETAMLGLRLTDGLSLARFAERYGVSFADVFGERLREMYALGLLEDVEGRVRLTARGKLVGNEVFARVLPDDDGRSSD